MQKCYVTFLRSHIRSTLEPRLEAKQDTWASCAQTSHHHSCKTAMKKQSLGEQS